jgi:hypothetical protein
MACVHCRHGTTRTPSDLIHTKRWLLFREAHQVGLPSPGLVAPKRELAMPLFFAKHPDSGVVLQQQ